MTKLLFYRTKKVKLKILEIPLLMDIYTLWLRRIFGVPVLSVTSDLSKAFHEHAGKRGKGPQQ